MKMVITVPGTRPSVCMQAVQCLYCSYCKGKTKVFMALDVTLACTSYALMPLTTSKVASRCQSVIHFIALYHHLGGRCEFVAWKKSPLSLSEIG
jgi:hypothetical protein